MGLIYFEATQYFIETSGKEPRAPFLVIDRESIGKQFIPLLSKVLKRKLLQDDINELINLFSFGSDNIFDLYYKPLVLKDDKVTLIPSLL